MKKKFLGRVLTMLLVASMVFTLLPAPAIAAGNWWWNNDEAESLADTTDSILPHRIIHLDCGRKYFSVDNVKSLIDVMAAYGYNELELAFGNAGLRFLLNDMSISFTTENGTTSYSNDDICTAVVEGNKKQNNSNDDSYWTETDMTEILGYASSKNIEIVPLLNMPGHMNALLDGEQFHQYRISGTGYDENKNKVQKTSCTSIDPGEADAAAFGHAILQKYVDWFKAYNDLNPDGKVKYFNFGADEVGNDIVNPFYANDLNPNRYNSCVEYINGCASIIEAAGMLPRAFNDFLYFYSGNVQIDKNIEVCYWNNQWSGSPYASANAISSRGHKMINTNSEWYYVLGVKNNNLTYALESVEKYNYNDFFVQGQAKNIQTIADTAGVMLCIWCDNPNAESSETAIKEATQLFVKFAEKNSAVFPAKGEIPPTPQPEPTEPTTKEINIAVGQRHTETIDGNHPGPYEGIDTNIATVTGEVISGTTATPTRGNMVKLYNSNINSAEGVISDGKDNYLKVSDANITNTNSITDATRFKVKIVSSNMVTIQVLGGDDNLYLGFGSGNEGLYVNNQPSYWTVGTGHDFSKNNNYIAYKDGTWTNLVEKGWDYGGRLYEVKPGTTSTADKTELTFTGVKRGDTEVTIGTTKYLIHVSEAQLSDNRICINYYITNHRVEDENGSTSRWVSAGEGNINSDKGVAIEDLIALTGTDTDTFTKKATKFYKATAQSGNNIQTDAGWTNKIAAGDNCAKLRYWNNTWSVCDANGQWHDVVGKTAEYNPDTQREASAYGKNDGYAAITAYYGQKTEVTDEITTYATDWGGTIPGAKDLGGEYALLDFAVKYQSGDRTPSKFATSKTIVYNAKGDQDYAYSENGNTRIVKDLFVENTEGYEVYMITVTKNNNALPTADTALSSSTKISYKTADTDVSTNDEMVVWVDKEEDLGYFNSADKQYPGYKVGGDPIVSAIYVAQQSAYLVTYYVRAVSKDQLQVNYIDLATNKPFYHYGINVSGTTTFSENIALNRDTADSWKGDLVNGTVTNDKNKNQTVSADLSTMPEIGAEYRHVAYTCDHIQLSADHKVLNLYYRFNNTVTFVADFGLPITINKGDLSKTLTNAGVEITEVKAAGVNHGAVEINEDVVTYTPDKRFVADENGESFTLTYTGTNVQETGSEGKVAYRVNILPASNVLYEENFLTESNESGLGWTEGTTVAPTTPQQTQKAKADGNVFGYDAAYVPSDTNPVTGELGVWTATGLEFSKMTKALTTEFYGNGFDLIGNCGPDTGRVMIAFTKQGANVPCRVVMVNTRFNDSKVATTLHQVPWAHVELGVDDAMYKVEIFASGNETNSSSRTMFASGYAAETDAFDSILAAYGMSASDVEYINVADTITEPSAYAVSYASVAADVTADQTIEVDGFRVYRSTNNANYPTSEQNVTYENILDVVKDEITAYTENGNGGKVDVKEYEKKGGPQNEIYLGKGQSVIFKIENVNSIQVSLRAVNGTATWNGNNITSNTEMYYTLEKDSSGVFTIANSSDKLLAIGNVKIPGTAGEIRTASELPEDVVLASVRMALGASGESNAFDPAISAKVTTTRFIRSKVVTLTVSASADVEKLMVNGVELRPTNSWLVKMGWSDTYTYILTEKVQKNEIKTYEIVGYRADGAASAPIVVKSK